MKIVTESVIFNYSARAIWEIISNISRSDWLPTVNKINIEDDCRIFEMEGMGSIKERIIECNHETMTLRYSAIETRTPIKHHLATMQLLEKDNAICELKWTTEIEPEIFSNAIYEGMLISIEGLKMVLNSES
jgi:hypothetical protein